jgi:hypothetical protein
MPNISTGEQGFTAGTNPRTINTTCPSGATILYVTFVAQNAHPTGITWNGAALTNVKQSNTTSSNMYVSIWRLANPDAGAHSLVATSAVGDLCHIGYLFADAVDVSGTPEDGSGATATGDSTSVSTNISTTQNDTLMISALVVNGIFASNYVAGGSATRFMHSNTNGQCEGGASYKILTASGTNAASWSWTSSLGTQVYAHCVVAAKLIVAVPDDDERDAELHGQDTANSERDAETSGVGAVALTAAQDGENIHLEWDYPA